MFLAYKLDSAKIQSAGSLLNSLLTNNWKSLKEEKKNLPLGSGLSIFSRISSEMVICLHSILIMILSQIFPLLGDTTGEVLTAMNFPGTSTLEEKQVKISSTTIATESTV